MKLNNGVILVRSVGNVSILAALSMAAASVQAEGASQWHVSGGASYRGGMKTTVSGSSRVQTEGIQAAGAYSTTAGALVHDNGMTVGPNLDDITQAGDRSFDNGFVNQDSATYLDGKTANWGYNTASQYDPVANTMTYVRTTTQTSSGTGNGSQRSVSVKTDLNTELSGSENFDAVGPVVSLVYDLMQRDAMSVSLAMQLRCFWGMDQSFSGSTFKQTVNERSYAVQDTFGYMDTISDTYVFSTATGMPIPGAPYGGSLNPADPTIFNRPDSATRTSVRTGSGVTRAVTQTGSATWHAANQIDLNASSDLYQFSVGPQLGFQAAKRVRLNVAPVMTANFVSTEVSRKEAFVATYSDGHTKTLNSWQDDASNNAWKLGAGIQAGLDLALTDSWSLDFSAGYDYIDKVNVDCGPNQVSIDLSAYTASASVGYSF